MKSVLLIILVTFGVSCLYSQKSDINKYCEYFEGHYKKDTLMYKSARTAAYSTGNSWKARNMKQDADAKRTSAGLYAMAGSNDLANQLHEQAFEMEKQAIKLELEAKKIGDDIDLFDQAFFTFYGNGGLNKKIAGKMLTNFIETYMIKNDR